MGCASTSDDAAFRASECDAQHNRLEDAGWLQAGDPAQPVDVLQDVAPVGAFHKAAALELGEDSGNVLPAPAAEARQV